MARNAAAARQPAPDAEDGLDGIEQRLIMEMLDAMDRGPPARAVEELSEEGFDELLALGRPEDFARLVVGMSDSFRRLLLEAACQEPVPLPHVGSSSPGMSFEQIAAALEDHHTVSLTTRPVGSAEWLSGRLFGERPALPHGLRFAETYVATGVNAHDGTRFVRLRDEAGRRVVVPCDELAEHFAAVVVND